MSIRSDLEFFQKRNGHLLLVIQTAFEALRHNDEASAFLILKNCVEQASDEVLDEKSLQRLPVQAEPEVPPETGEDAGHS